METIPKNNCVKVGYIQKPHGIHGELVIRFQEEFYETLEEYPTLFLEIDNLLVPYFITNEGLRFKSGESVIAQLDWVDTDKKAKELSGLPVYVNEEDVIELEDEKGSHELIGFLLFDVILGLIGEINHVHDYSGNVLLSVEYQGNEALVPLNEDLIVTIDQDRREIVLRIPDGLFDLEV
ncbi:MAG: ribosome maturation factor RimM [Bacteroidota bacterium]|nr:16S rRNA processing protein RimM [Odoribacter sp.]MDP3643337.1 ribosome maturation factor RimM [Bacteroidota bacterium]